MKRVFICSRYAGDVPRNIATAERLGLDEVAAGFRALEAERAGRIPNS